MGRKKVPRAVPQPRRPKGGGTVFFDNRRQVFVARLKGCGEHRSPDRAVCVAWLRTARPPAPGAAVTVGEWLDRWLAGVKVRPNSRRAYTQHVERRLKPSFGAIRLDRLTAYDVESAANGWAGKPSTVRSALAVLGTALRAAVRAELVPRSVAALARKPEPDDQAFDLFSRAELRKMFDTAIGSPEWHTFAVLACTGCRIAEALGLRAGDYDPAAGTLRIERQRSREGGTAKPKSRRSTRTITVPPALAPALAAPEGLSYAGAVKRWRKLLDHLGLRRRGTHQVRHSVASYLLADGFPVADLANFLGHTPAELLKTYGHKTGADAGVAAAKLLGLKAG